MLNSIRISVSRKGLLGIRFGLRHAYINLLDILLFSLSTRGDHWPPTLFDPFTKDCLVWISCHFLYLITVTEAVAYGSPFHPCFHSSTVLLLLSNLLLEKVQTYLYIGNTTVRLLLFHFSCFYLQIDILWCNGSNYQWWTSFYLLIFQQCATSCQYIVEGQGHFFMETFLTNLHYALFWIVLQIIIFGDKVILDDPIEMYVMRTQVIDNSNHNSFQNRVIHFLCVISLIEGCCVRTVSVLE